MMRRLAFLLTGLLLLAGCDRRPLEIYYPDAARIRIDVDWLSHYGYMPTGMTMLFYANGNERPQTVVTNSVQSNYVDLKPATYKMIIFNQSSDEFGSMRFDDLSHYLKAAARARPVTLRQNAEWDEDVTYMADPELLGVAVDTFTVTEDMLEEQIHFADYRERIRGIQPDTAVYVLSEVVERMTTTINVLVHVRGFSNMRSVEGNLSGMADGCYLSQVWRTTDTGILLLDGWKNATGTRADPSVDEGWISVTMPTFGLPHGKELENQRVPDDNTINLCFTLKDGSTRLFTYQVGTFIHYRGQEVKDHITPSDVTLELELILDAPLIDPPELPDVDDDGGGGFTAEVDDWEYGGDIDIGL